jgi:hypothetical protein
MPELFQVIDDEAEYVLVIEEQKRKRPNSPGTSKRQHFERANQKRRKKDFEWYAPPGSRTSKIERGGELDKEDSKRFTWTAPTEPHVEPPRPEGWKPLVLTPQKVRSICDQRLKEWSKDQEEYAEQQFQGVQKRIQEQKQEPRPVGVDSGPSTSAPVVGSSSSLTGPTALQRFFAHKERSIFVDPDERETKAYLDARDEEARLRHERKLEQERIQEERVRKELESNPLPEETERERKSRRDEEWLKARFRVAEVWVNKRKLLNRKIQELRNVEDGIIDEFGIQKLMEEFKKAVRSEEAELRNLEQQFRTRWQMEDKVLKEKTVDDLIFF